MAQRDVAINLLTKLQDKGFRDLEKSTKKSNKALIALGKRLAATFSVVAVTAYAKKSIAAFLAEEKAIRRLTIALENAGEGVNRFRAEEFVATLQRTARVADDQLRPALISLTNAGIGFTQSQELLKLALDVSAGSGQSLETVTRALSRAFNGNNTALSRLGVGLSKSQLKVASFDDVVSILSLKFEGQAAAAAGTYAGRLEGINIAADEASETIGKALVTAIDTATKSATGAEDALKGLSEGTADLIVGVGQLTADLRTLDLNTYFENALVAANQFLKSGLNPIVAGFNFFTGKGAKLNLEESLKLSTTNVLPDLKVLQREVERTAKVTQLNAKLAAQEAKKTAAAQKKSETEKKRSAELERLRKSIQYKFDIDAINIAAALKRNISNEDRQKLLELQALKLSDYQSDEDAIKTLQAVEQGRFDLIQKSIEELIKLNPEIKFTDNLKDILAKLEALINGKYSISIGATITVPNIPAPGGSASSGIGAGSRFDPGSFRAFEEATIAPNEKAVVPPPVIKSPFIDLPGEVGGEPAFAARPLFPDVASFRRFEETQSSDLRNLYGAGAIPSNFDVARFRMGEEGVTVNVNVSGSVIAQNDLVAAVTDAVYQTQRTGNSLLIAE